jgi:hypothetical protein
LIDSRAISEGIQKGIKKPLRCTGEKQTGKKNFSEAQNVER